MALVTGPVPGREPWKRCLGPSQEMPTRCWLPAPACMSLTHSHLNCLLGVKETGPWSPVGRMVSLEDDLHSGASDAARPASIGESLGLTVYLCPKKTSCEVLCGNYHPPFHR